MGIIIETVGSKQFYYSHVMFFFFYLLSLNRHHFNHTPVGQVCLSVCLSRNYPNKTLFGRFKIMIWLVVLGFNATLTSKIISWRSLTHMCFLAFSHQYQHNFFSKPLTTFLTCFSRGERRKNAGKKSSPQPGIELTTTRSDTLTTEPRFASFDNIGSILQDNLSEGI